jgi:hypothetical protein
MITKQKLFGGFSAFAMDNPGTLESLARYLRSTDTQKMLEKWRKEKPVDSHR